MENIAVTQRSFASGELSPFLHRRADIEKFRSGLALCKNCVVLPYGGATSRSGTRFIAQAQAASRLVPFQFSRSVGYVIELADEKARFYKDKATILDGMSNPYEVTTPWTAAQLDGIDWAQSADVLYVVHADVPETQLQRLGDNNWNVVESDYEGGPFRRQNLDEAHRLYITTALPGTPDFGYVKGTFVTLKSTKAVFTADHVGALFKLAEQDKAGSGNDDEGWSRAPDGEIGTWKDLDYTTAGIKVRVGDSVYALIARSGTGSGGDPPTHTEGEAWYGTVVAGDGKFLWRYQHSGFGIVKITGVTSATEAIALVQSFVPDSLRGTETGSSLDAGGSHRWAEGAWSEERGYPDAITFHEQRKMLAQGQTIFGSVIDDFQNMAEGTADDEAFQYTLAAQEQNDVQWLASVGWLNVGTAGEELAFGGGDNREPMTPTRPGRVPGSSEGSKRVRPARVDGPVFVAADGTRILRLHYALESNHMESEDLSVLAEHLFQTGVEETAWQREPYRILWCRLSDGTLASLTYMREQQVLGAHRHEIENGFVESLAVIRSAAGAGQELWMIVRRTIDSQTVRYIEVLEPFFEKSGGADILNAWFLDCAVLYDGAATDTITGLDHLEGETVRLFADGKVHPEKTVSGGQVTLDYQASKVLAGYDFDARLRSLPFDGEHEGGSLTGENKKTNAVLVALKNTAGAQALAVAGPDDPPAVAEELQPSGGGVMGAPSPLFTGLVERAVEDSFDLEGQIEVFQDKPLPFTVLAWTPNRQVE